MAAEPVQLPTSGSLAGILDVLETDEDFRALISDEIEVPESDIDPSITVGVPEGLRPALAAGAAGTRPVVLVVASGREAEEMVEAIRSWYSGDPNDVAQLEAWETLPHERLSPRADTVASRMAVFRRLMHPQEGSKLFGPIRILVMPVRSLIQPVVAGLGDVEPLVFSQGEELALDEASHRLVENAYTRVDLVMDRGEFAVRGGIIDVFPPTLPHPVRIEFFGDEIDTIKEFHASDQRTYGSDIPMVWATPCRELQLTEKVRVRAKSLIGSIPNAEDMLESIANAIPVEGMESLLPALVDDMEPVQGMLPKRALVMLSDPEKLRRAADDLAKTANEFLAASWHVAASGHGAGAPITFDQANFYDFEETISSLVFSRHDVWKLTSFGVDSSREGRVQLDATNPGEYRGDEAKTASGIEGLLDAGYAVTVTAGAQGTLVRLKRAINETGIANFDCIRSRAIDGFVDNAAKVALLTERDLTGRTSAAGQAKTPKRRRKAIDLMELKAGDYVVHEQHGIGRFLEMRQRTIGAGANQTTREYLVIEYASSKRGAPADKLFIPTDQLDQVSKYIGADAPKLNKLGGSDWAATKAKARKHVHEIAEDLVKLYSARQRMQGYAFSKDTPWQKELEDAFPYQETADQLTTIDEVKSDMEKPVPMDRLICGDVGFGKTEIAVRAAFKAVQDSKQVAVLVPTTLLVQQHFETFTERFEGFPVEVRAMSRFQTAKEINDTIEGLEDGSVDVVIGTHKLLQSDVKFKDLGLLIVDEEHRFGVRHKERIKAMRANVDILTLTATPIPRTLNMAMSGMRDLSIIATPPARRLAVKTFVREYDSMVVREAILREILRGGQVYYLYNDVENIQKAAERLAELVPEARIAIGHGQMRERELERVMNDFHHQRFNVLVCTTIIETGIDIPTANTIIIERADHFGLAQLHQLRGRVGRSHHQAYAWLLTPHPKAMTTDAQKRLEAIASLEDLGAGFALATHDLEIRGAGELLGEEQSGSMETIGFSLYMELLENAVDALKAGREPSLEDLTSQQTEVELRMPSLLPDDFIPDVNTRLSFYKRIASAKTENELEEIKVELIDRFGLLPDPARTLLDIARLRQQAQKLGIRKLEGNEKGGVIEFAEKNHVNPAWLIGLLQKQPQHYRLDGPTRLKFIQDLSERKTRIEWVRQFMRELEENAIA